MPAEAPTAPAAPPPSTPPPQSPAPSAGSPPGQAPSPGATPAPEAPAPRLDAFADIDRIIADTQQKAPKPPGARRPQKPPAETKTTNGETKPVEDATKPQAGETTPPPGETDDTQTLKAPELRAAYSRTKKELKTMKEQLAAREARVKELESKAAELEELPKVKERMTAAEKRAEEIETELRFANYERSQEYQDKYYKPFLDAYQSGRNKVGQLKIMQRTDEMGEITQPARKATAEDFDALMRISDDAEAAEFADRMFGPMANLVIYHREKVMDLNNSRANAIEDYRKKGDERQQQFETQSKAMQEKVRNTFQASVKEGMTKYPQWFKADDGDDQGKQVLEKGLLNADSVFSATNHSPEERAQIHAAFRNMAGAFPYVALKLHRAEGRIKELEEELKEFRASGPNESGERRGPKTGPLTAEDEIDAMATRRS